MVRETGRAGYKAGLVVRLKELFPGCLIVHNDPVATHQGIPDMTVIYKDRWAMLEAKAAANSKRQPNQDYWIDHYNQQSFASFIYPENETEVLNGLSRSFASSGHSRHAKRK